MKACLEILRIIFIIVLLGALLSSGLVKIYSALNVEKYRWLGFISIYLLIFVLYRNKLQFRGWYKSKNNKKLSKTLTTLLLVISALLISIPILFLYLH